MAKSTYSVYQIVNPTQPNEDKILFEITIEVPDDCEYTDYEWNSKTALVTAYDPNSQKRVIVPYTGIGAGKVPPGPFRITQATGVDFNFWYY